MPSLDAALLPSTVRSFRPTLEQSRPGPTVYPLAANPAAGKEGAAAITAILRPGGLSGLSTLIVEPRHKHTFRIHVQFLGHT